MTLECVQQLRQGTSSRQFAPLGMCYFVSLILSDFVLCFGYFFKIEFVDSVKVQGTCTCTNLITHQNLVLHRRVEMQRFCFILKQIFLCYCGIIFFSCNCTSLSNFLFCFC